MTDMIIVAIIMFIIITTTDGSPRYPRLNENGALRAPFFWIPESSPDDNSESR
jgi:hypothetical protein